MPANDKMTAGRFLRLHRSRRKVAWIVAHLEAGRSVQITTATRATRYTAKHVGMFKATKSGAYVQRGKAWDCFDFADVRAFE